jgi:hypothetical protein
VEPLIPKPFLLNPFKHHSGFLKAVIHQHRRSDIKIYDLEYYLLKMGNCMIDLYFGDAGVKDIIREVGDYLKKEGIYEQNQYIRRLSVLPKKYLNIQLSDGSSWTLLVSDDETRYIHIHPARRSKNCVRVRAIALKTALILKIYYFEELETTDMVTLVNRVRQNYLDESPIKNFSYTKGIRKALDHL